MSCGFAKVTLFSLPSVSRREPASPKGSPGAYDTIPLGEAQDIALPGGRVRRRSQPRRGVRIKRGRVSLLFFREDPLQSPVRFTAGASFPQGKPWSLRYDSPRGRPRNSPPSREGPSKIPASKRRADQAGESVFSISQIITSAL